MYNKKQAINHEANFKKTIGKESLAVLTAVYEWTLELKQKYWKSFYPKFTVTEVSEKTGLTKEQTKTLLDDSVGIGDCALAFLDRKKRIFSSNLY